MVRAANSVQAAVRDNTASRPARARSAPSHRAIAHSTRPHRDASSRTKEKPLVALKKLHQSIQFQINDRINAADENPKLAQTASFKRELGDLQTRLHTIAGGIDIIHGLQIAASKTAADMYVDSLAANPYLASSRG